MKLAALLAALLVVVGAAVALDDAGRDGAIEPVSLGEARLISVQSCDELLDWYRESAAAVDVGALGGFGFAFGRDGEESFATTDADDSAGGQRTAAGSAPSPESPDSAASGGVGGGDEFSGTNTQERDVDEPDTVKTNGDVLVHASYDRIDIIDVGDGEPRLLSTVDVEDGGTELLLDGDRVLALTNTYRERSAERRAVASDSIGIMPVGEQVVVLTAIDISDPASPQVVATSEIDGGYRSARVTGSTARIVLTSHPQLPQPDPAVYESPDPDVIEQRLEEWQDEAIASMTLDDWVPSVDGERGVACDAVSHPAEPSGTSTTTVITLDLQGNLERLDEDAVVADAGTVYASTDRLYVATSQWAQTFGPEGGVGSEPPSTELHAFDITDPSATSYVGSGRVPGFLLNQFSLSERGGFVRVATTQEPPWDPNQEIQATSSSLTVLAEQGDALVEVGRVDGLGPTERIQAVRFLDDVAYVVTFRRTDPLFVIDLSDPTSPAVQGELKVPGYSAYLHPIDDGRVLGIGQDADDEGRTFGTQVSTFDVSDPTAPSRTDSLTIRNGSSMVEYDHRAFLWWAGSRLAVLPIDIYQDVVFEDAPCPPDADCAPASPPPGGREQRPFMGAVVFGVSDDGSIAERGRVSHDGRGPQADGWYTVVRSVVIGDALYTISEAGVLKSDLSSLTDEGFAQFPAPVYETFEGGGTSGETGVEPGSVEPVAP